MYGHRLVRELLGLLFLFCGLLMLLSLWSYHAGDPTFNQAVSIDPSSIQNAAGLFGAYLSGFFVDIFGLGSFLWVIFFLAVGAGLVSRWIVLKWYRWIGYLLLFACGLVVSSIYDLSIHGIHGGGLSGQWLSAFSFLFFSPTGSFLLWIFVFLIAMELSFSISWLTLITAVFSWILKKVPSFGSTYDLPVPHFPESWKRIFNLFCFKKTEREVPRPRTVLDIVLHSESSPEKILEKEAGDSGKTESVSGELQLIEFSENSTEKENEEVPSSSSEENTFFPGGEEQDTFIVELIDPVNIPAESEHSSGETEGEEALEHAAESATEKDEERSDSVEDEALSPSAMAAVFSCSTSSSSVEFPAAVRAVPLECGKDEETEQEQTRSSSSVEAKKDEDYASVDTAVAEAMAIQQEDMAGIQDASVSRSPKRRELSLPPWELLAPIPEEDISSRPDEAMLSRQGNALITCLKNFNVHASLARITPGPVVTMFELRPAPGVKATRITNLANDLAMSLKAVAVRMQAPVPGTDTVGVEVPNEKRMTVHFREIVENDNFRNAKSLLTIALGKDTGGRPVSADLAKMPHLLVAGATGTGKSVCLNTIILSLLYRARPDEVQLILVDPKRVELSMYADLPHLVHPVVTDMDLTKNALLWAIDEMNRRLSLFSKVMVRNITGYNERQARLRAEVEAGGAIPLDKESGEPEDLSNMPFLVIIIDELSDLMMVKRKEVEGSIVRLAQLARAAGIHLIIATQRPSVDVVTGIIKANFPCRIAFRVSSGQDSRTIIDGTGAEKLLGMGDMLFKPNGGILQRLHGAFVSDEEVSSVVAYWKQQQPPNYKIDFSEFGNDESEENPEDFGQGSSRGNDIVDDPIYAEAVQFVLENGKVSISLLQRRFRIGFNRAARFVEQMEKDGLLSQADGSRPRSVVHR